uniref:Uncharacterized protein n=1 Tax=Gouania willdenowi TaxID=441366 RepID=A0A8C5EN53_GOUWI
MAQSRRGCSCSVPGCSCGARKQPYLSYHAFLTDPDQRSQRILSADLVIIRHLQSGAVPSLFPWNNFIAPPERKFLYYGVCTSYAVDSG